MSPKSEAARPNGRPWSLALRLPAYYACSAFLIVAAATSFGTFAYAAILSSSLERSVAVKAFVANGSDVQGLVDEDGRWRPVDFQSVQKLPPETQPHARKAALARHGQMIDGARNELRELAEQNEPPP